LPTIDVLVGNLRQRLAVDTGCELTVLSPALAAELRIDLAKPVRVDRLAGVGLSAPVPTVALPPITVGRATVPNLLGHIFQLPAPLRVDGLLGLNFLSRFRITFEFDTATLVLRSLQ